MLMKTTVRVLLLAIYDKSKMDNIADASIDDLIENLPDDIL
jgi:hypothetical protein